MEANSKAWLSYKSIKASGKPFVDETFNFSNALNSSNPQHKALLWTRYSSKSAGLFSNISTEDILQGSVGDCYFVSALASFAQNPDRVRKLFLTLDLNPTIGAYLVQVWVNGKREEILLDDFIPEDPRTSSPAFAKSASGQLWVLLLEKAWAKVCGGYENISKGTAAEALRFLTGAPCDRIEHIEYTATQIWAELSEAIKEKYIICGSAGNKEGVDSECESIGLTSNHGYSILGKATLNLPGGKTENLLLLRNPVGYSNFRGDWSKSSGLWNLSVIAQLPGKALPANQGLFYISVKDYAKYFRATYICREKPGFIHETVQCKIPLKEQAVIVKAEIKEGTKAVLTVSQATQRVERVAHPNYSPRRVYFLLGKTMPCGVEYISGALGSYEDVSIAPQQVLSGGNYVIYLELDSLSPKDDSYINKFFVHSYSDKPVKLLVQDASAEYARKTLQELLKSCAKQMSEPKDYSEHGDGKIKRYSSINDSKAGFGYYYYVNESLNNSLYEIVTLTKMKGVSLKKTNTGKTNEFEVTVPPQKEEIVILKKTDKDSQVSSRQKIAITKVSGTAEEKKVVKGGLSDTIISKGKCQQIGKTDAYLYEYKDTGRFILLIQNKSKSKRLSCAFEFSLTNLIFTEGPNKFTVQLSPGATAIKTLNITNKAAKTGYTYKANVQEITQKPKMAKPESKKSSGKRVSAISAKHALDDVIDMYGALT